MSLVILIGELVVAGFFLACGFYYLFGGDDVI